MAAKNGNSRPQMGRKLCTSKHHAGPRWIHAHNFAAAQRTRGGEMLYLHVHCRACQNTAIRLRRGLSDKPRKYGRQSPTEKSRQWLDRIYSDPERHERQKEYWRFQAEKRRRARGAVPRRLKRMQSTGLPRDYHGHSEKFLPAGPFLEWVEGYKRVGIVSGSGQAARWGPGVLPLEELCKTAGTSDKRVREARTTGKIAEWIVDAILIAAGGRVMVRDLYPED